MEPLNQAEEYCLHFCVRRKGFSLFRVSEQVHLEATESWSRHHVDITFLRAADMWSAFPKVSQSARSCIKSLKLYELDRTCGHRERCATWGGQELILEFLPDLVNLQYLEVPPRLMTSGASWSFDYDTEQSVTTGNVRKCFARMYSLESISLTLLLGESFKDICSRSPLRGMFVTISDIHETRRGEAAALKRLPCRSSSEWNSRKVDAICQSADKMVRRQWPSTFFVDPLPTLKQFEREAPAYSEDVPCTFQSRLQGRDYGVSIWGLPEASLEARRRRMAEQRMAEAERHRRLCESVNKVHEEESEDDAGDTVRSKATHRMRTRVAPRKDEKVQKIEAENRTRRNANREKREHVQESKKAKKESEGLREVQKLAMEAKRATRKRTSRNQRDIRER